ncbi:MAG TPA: lipoyl(octanoyl) transferase LipB [Candidatus Eisenbacteria bacterium]|nr:lipoyl(octanoyl) transferase LipB [Candidatus Eisenbacteria bacterium]
MSTLSVAHLGPTPYREGLALQEAMVRAVAEGSTGDWLLFPDHPPVLTVGRSGSDASLRADPAVLERLGIEVFEVARGGDYTWHGPGQAVGYLICDLTARGRDLHQFLRDIEQGLISALGSWGLAGETVPGKTGVWVAGEKIASLGVAVRRWVSYHGFALNVAPDLSFFDLIHPCGLRGIHMTSLASRLGAGAPSLAQAREVVASHLAHRMGYGGWVRATAGEAHSAAGRARDGSRDVAGAAR